MNNFNGELTHSFDVSFPEEIWDLVSSPDWQAQFFSLESKEALAKWIGGFTPGTDFSKMDGFYGVEAAKNIKVSYWRSEVELWNQD